MAHPYSADDFDQHTGKSFRAAAAPDGPEIVLSRVERASDTEVRERAGLPPGYTVIFSGPPEPVLAEGLHALTSDDGSVFEVYVNPIHTPARDRQDYQAVFG